MEEELRKTAIERFKNGESPKQIYSSLNRSKKWFFKWLNRFGNGDKDWFKDQSRAPKHRPTRIEEVDRQRIIAARKRLETQPFAQIGTSAIKWELNKAGYRFPSDSTIHRVLKNEGLIKKKLHIFLKGLNTPTLHRHLTLTIFTRPTLSDRATSKEMADFIR